jgi:RNA polymerase sigma factor (TIGR02999 family)
MTPAGQDVTRLLHQWGAGDPGALDQLVPLVYRELRKMAKRYMRQQDPNHTLQSTAIVHEAYVKLLGGGERDWENRSHFFAVAAKAMRQVLVDHARSRLSVKRGGQMRRVELEEGAAMCSGREREIVALDEALTALAAVDPRKGEVVELRYFSGLSVEETAKVLNVSPKTVARDWDFAKAFLQREIKREPDGS